MNFLIGSELCNIVYNIDQSTAGYEPQNKNQRLVFLYLNSSIIYKKSKKEDVDCILVYSADGQTLWVAFTGLDSCEDVIDSVETNFIYPLGGSSDESSFGVHLGFYKKYLAILSEIHGLLNNFDGTHINFVGHSLGGTTASLYAYFYNLEYPKIYTSVVTFGCPTFCNRTASQIFHRSNIDYYRFINSKDPIPNLSAKCAFNEYYHVDVNVIKFTNSKVEISKYEDEDKVSTKCFPCLALKVCCTNVANLVDHNIKKYVKKIARHNRELQKLNFV